MTTQSEHSPGTEVATIKREVSISVNELRKLAVDFAASAYFKDARSAAQAVVKIQAGRELGLSPVYSMTKIYIVEGKVTVGAEVMGALVKRSRRYDYRVKTLTDEECVIDFTDNGTPSYSSRFTMADAKRAGLVKPQSGWEKYPRAMLFSKAISQGARIVCPHVIGGVYTPEDFGLSVNDDGDVMNAPVVTLDTTTGEMKDDNAAETPDGSEQATGGQEHFCTVHNVPFVRHENNNGTWYSHKTADGKWCNEKDAAKQEAKPSPEPPKEPQKAPAPTQKSNTDNLAELAGMTFKDAGEFMKACHDKLGLMPSAVLKEVPEYDLDNAAQRDKAWQQVVGAHGQKMPK
jgi:hypothetical protein